MPSALNTDALTTLSNLKDELGITTSDKDNRLERAINRATQWIEGRTERKLKARRYNGGSLAHTNTGVPDEDYLFFSGSTKDQGGDTIVDPVTKEGVFHLPQFPVQSNDALTFVLQPLASRASSGETWDTALVEWQDYVLDRPNGILRLKSGPFAADPRNYRITMAAGYQYGSAQPYVPPDLESLCIEIAKGLYRDNRGVTGESLGTWSRQYSVTLKESDPAVQDTLARYRRFSL